MWYTFQLPYTENPQYDEYGMRIIERGDLNETFCSTQYKALLQKAYEISEDEMILDYDHWTYSQDDNQFTCKPGKVENITDSTAIAYVKAKNFDEEYMIILSLVFERGDWYVDDFLSLDGDSEKAYLERQIRERDSLTVKGNGIVFVETSESTMTKKIINPWRNNPAYNCFGCCPENPIGLHLEFYEDGDYIVSKWHPEKNYQGWVNTLHGGILSTLIDEVCGWVVTRKLQTSGYTVQLNVKFRKAVSTTEPELTIRAKVTKQVRNLIYIRAEITNAKGELCNEGEAVYFLMKQDKAKEMGFVHCDVEE